MLDGVRRIRLVILGALAVAASACARGTLESPAEPVENERLRYLRDPAFRRSTLERSLRHRNNAYADRRLRQYREGPGGWGALPTFNPPVRLQRSDESSSEGARPLRIPPAATDGDTAALRALGEEAFFRYPAQPAPYVDATASGHGLDHGVVSAQVHDGAWLSELTCAACHVRRSDGAVFIGAPNDRLDLGALLAASARRRPRSLGEAGDERAAYLARLVGWGPGRVDVTTQDGTEPLRIPDLRPVRFQSHLQASGAVVMTTVVDLALRIETLLITAHDEALRPPREVSLGLAIYLWSLADGLPRAAKLDEAQARGATVFSLKCGRCHAGEGLSGGWVPAAVVGTEPSIARSLERGTGGYRIPSLRGLRTRGSLFHDGTLASIDRLFDRASEAGHSFGADLAPLDRSALIAYLRAL